MAELIAQGANEVGGVDVVLVDVAITPERILDDISSGLRRFDHRFSHHERKCSPSRLACLRQDQCDYGSRQGHCCFW